MAVKDIQFKIEVDASQAVNNLAQYRDIVAGIDNQIADLRKQMKEEGADTKTLGQEIARLTEKKKAYNKEITNTSREVQNNLVASSEKYNNTLKGMRAQLSAAKDALAGMALGTAEYAEQAEKVKQLNDEVKGLEQEYGVFTRSVGDYENAIKNALASTNPMAASIANLSQESGGAATMVGNIGTAFKNVGKAGLALLANPVFAVLAGLAAVVMAIKKAINSSEEATARWNVVLAPLNRGLDAIINVAQKMAGAVLSAFETAGDGFDWLLSKLEKMPIIGDAIAKMNKANAEAIQLEKDKYSLTKQTRKDEEENAKSALEVAKLRTQAKDKEKYSAAERLRFIQEAAKIEEEIAQRNVEREKERLRIMEAEASRAQNNAETEDALSQQRAAVYRAEMDYYNKTRELLEQENTARNEMAADAKAIADARYQQEAMQLAQYQELLKSKAEFDKIYFYDYSLSAEENAELRYQHEQEYAARSLQLQQQLAQEKLDLDLKYNRITQEEYNTQMQLMADERAKFQQEQLADIEEHNRNLMAKVVELAGGMSKDAKLADLEAQYKQAFDTLTKNAKISADERAYYEEQLAKELARKKEEIFKESEGKKTDTTKKELEERKMLEQEHIAAVTELAYSLNDAFNAFGDAQVQRAEQDNAKQKKELEKRLNAGLISQKNYDKEVAKLDEELDKKKAKIAREQAIREKALGVAQIAMNTAAAVMRIWADVPKGDFGISTGILTALAVATGAAQTAAVLATPIPEARTGGMVLGRTHENGGVLMNLEDQERIVGAKPSKAFPELLNLIAYIGNHAQMPNTGYATRSMMIAGGGAGGGAIDADLLAQKIGEQVSDAVRQMPIYLSLTELREEQEVMARIEESAKI